VKALYLLFDAYGGIAEMQQMLKAIRLDKVLPLPPAALPEWHGIESALTPEPEGPPTY
jgi:hypothetical protein